MWQMNSETYGIKVLDPSYGNLPLNPPRLQVKLQHESAKLPTKGSPHSAGYDLYASAQVVIPPKGRELIPLGISVKIPNGYYGRIAPRSSLALSAGIDVGAGVVDSDYRGLIGVVLFNHDHKRDFKVSIGDRIAQLIITPYVDLSVKSVGSLDQTKRGEGGFGSTGK